MVKLFTSATNIANLITWYCLQHIIWQRYQYFERIFFFRNDLKNELKMLVMTSGFQSGIYKPWNWSLS